MKKNTSWFTLVELIVVVTILVVLSTVWFISYESYLVDTRDSKRLSQMNNLRDALRLSITKWKLPFPDDGIELRQDGVVYAYQWYAWESVLESISFSQNTIDPLDDVYYHYLLIKNQVDFQLLWYLEKDPLESVLQKKYKTYANIDYGNRFPRVYGNELGIITEEDTNIPVHELDPYLTDGYLDLETATGTTFTAIVSNTTSFSWDADSLLGLVPFTTCKKLLLDGIGESGLHIINPDGKNPLLVYCDMETDGGWWTFTTFMGVGWQNIWLFTWDAGAYRADRSQTSTSYGLDTTIIPHDEVYMVRWSPDVTPALVWSGEVLNMEITDYRKPLLNIPYFPNTPGSGTYWTRFWFDGDYITTEYRFLRSSGYYQILLSRDRWNERIYVSLYEDGHLRYPHPDDRTDENFYDLSYVGSEDSEEKPVWYYVR